MRKKLSSGNIPEVGMGATICCYSDRLPATIIDIMNGGKKISLQVDTAIRLDSNGMSEWQEYRYIANPEGAIFTATRRKDGTYRVSGTKSIVFIGQRRKYYDYSF